MNPIEIEEQVNKVLQSRTFASKAQLRKLLEVLSRNIESQSDLKPSAVIQQLWPSEVRTKRSADIATEMNRLRRALDDYYAKEGASDPVLICLPNRAATGANGATEKRWIVALPRDGREAVEFLSAAAPALALRSSKRSRLAIWLVAALVLIAAAYIAYMQIASRGEPKSARQEGNAIVVVDAQGKELWRKSFAEGFGPDSYYEHGVSSRIWFADLEGKGHTSVLFSYLPAASAEPHSSTLICYSDRGKERWRWTPGRALPEIAGEVQTFKTYSLAVLKANGNTPLRLVIVSNHDPWWGGPSQIALLDVKGRTLSEYWHSGGLHDLVVADLKGTGKEEILATGVAHGYDSQATLVVLDPERVFGASKEVVPEFQLHGMGDAEEELRLLFTRSDFNRASFQFNLATEPLVKDGRLRVAVDECEAPLGCPIEYEFDRQIKLVAARPPNQEFKHAHDRYYQSGKDSHLLDAEEQTAFLSVRCLAGCNSEFAPVAETYDPAASFEVGWTKHANPNGVWSYGYSAGFTEPVTLYDKTVQNGINGPNAQYWLSSLVNSKTSPSTAYINGPAFNDGNSNLLANEFDLVAGIGGQYSDVIFQAPVSGEYLIDGRFRGAQYGVGTVVGVVAKGALVFRSSVTSVDQLVPFSMTENLQAGSRVTFSVGPGGGLQNTGLAVTITRPCGPSEKPRSAADWQIECSNALTETRKGSRK